MQKSRSRKWCVDGGKEYCGSFVRSRMEDIRPARSGSLGWRKHAMVCIVWWNLRRTIRQWLYELNPFLNISWDVNGRFPKTVKLLQDTKTPSCEVFFARQGTLPSIICYSRSPILQSSCWNIFRFEECLFNLFIECLFKNNEYILCIV